MVSNAIMVSKGITLLSQTDMFNKYIREWIHQSHDQKRRAFTATGKGKYTVAVQNIYGVPPPPTEDHHEAIDNLNAIIKGMQTQSCELEVMAKSNEVLTRSNSAFMEQFAQTTLTMNSIQAQIRILSSAPTNQTRSNRTYYFQSFRSNYTHGSKTQSAKKAGHQEEAYYKKRLGGRKKGCE